MLVKFTCGHILLIFFSFCYLSFNSVYYGATGGDKVLVWVFCLSFDLVWFWPYSCLFMVLAWS